MTIHLQIEIDRLKKKILYLAAVVEESLRVSIQALLDRNDAVAQGVIDNDEEVDRMEVELEEDCLKALALHQPVAIDLRFIVAVLKINSDLERIGDLAVNIAERARDLAGRERVRVDFDFRLMADKVEKMVTDSLDALVKMDPLLARRVCAADDEIDELHRLMYRQIEAALHQNPGSMGTLFNYMTVSRCLERVADHATNIAEDVIYMVDGDIVRHRLE